jgi:hypothetical protein
MLLRHLAGCALVALWLAPTAAPAAPTPAALTMVSEIQPAHCSFGTHLDVSGYCVDSMDYSRRCAPGMFAVSAPNGNGFRCLPAEWMDAPGWLGDFFH